MELSIKLGTNKRVMRWKHEEKDKEHESDSTSGASETGLRAGRLAQPVRAVGVRL